MQVPVIDSRGMSLMPCAIHRAQSLIKQGKAVPHHDDRGAFYIQLTYEKNPPARAVRPSQRGRKAEQRRARKLQQGILDSLSRAAIQRRKRARRMPIKLDQILVIDVESTCWEGEPPDGQQPEIIEIGVCTVDVRSGERLARQSILVQPERSTISPFCTELTSLTPAQIERHGVSFEQACGMLRREYGAPRRVWASYGTYDRRQFERQCLERSVEYPFSASHLNVKNLVALVYALPHEIGMIKALELLALPVEGVHHRGVDDAWNTGLLVATLIFQRRAELKP